MIQTRDKDIYKEHMSSDSWAKRKRLAFLIHGKACQRCKSTCDLTVHHKTYERLGKEDVEIDLAILCKECHELYHMSHPVASIETTDFFIAKGVQHLYIPRLRKQKSKKVKDNKGYQKVEGVYYIRGKKRKHTKHGDIYTK